MSGAPTELRRAEEVPWSSGGDRPTRALERRIVMFDCELLTEQEYSFTATVYFFTYNRRAKLQQKPLWANTAPLIALAGLVAPSRPPSFHRVPCVRASTPLPRLLSGCRLRRTGFWEVTSEVFLRSQRDAWFLCGYRFLRQNSEAFGTISLPFLHDGGLGS